MKLFTPNSAISFQRYLQVNCWVICSSVFFLLFDFIIILKGAVRQRSCLCHRDHMVFRVELVAILVENIVECVAATLWIPVKPVGFSPATACVAFLFVKNNNRVRTSELWKLRVYKFHFLPYNLNGRQHQVWKTFVAVLQTINTWQSKKLKL